MTPRNLWNETKSLWPFGMVLLAGIGFHYGPTWMPAHEMVSGP